jgi:RND superfamily putative drug exporter
MRPDVRAHHRNLAAAAGHWSSTHRRTAVLGWIVFVVAAFGIGSAVSSHVLTAESSGSGESQRAQDILDRKGLNPPASETVIVESRTATIADPAFRDVVRKVTAAVSRLPQVTAVQSPLGPAGAVLVSRDRRAALVAFDIRGDPDDAAEAKTIKPVLGAVARVAATSPGFYVAEFGEASAGYELNRTLGSDFHQAELLSIPITLFILFLAFGALVAAIVPLVFGITAVVAALGLNDIVSFAVPKGDATQSVILMIGLAVGVDYSLFYLRRTREERAAGKEPRRALLTAAGTSGQAVLVSGCTVLVAMGGLLIAGNPIFTSVGIGTMLVVAVAVIGSLSVLPAVLAKLGDRVERGRIPLLARRRNGAGESRFWRWVTGHSLRRPIVTLVVAGGALIALAVPALGMHTALTSFTDLPKGLAIVQTYDRIQDSFPGSSTPAIVAYEAPDVSAPPVKRAVAELERRALASGLMAQPVDVTPNRDGTAARLEIALLGGEDEQNQAVETLRRELVPETLGHVTGVTAAVGGSAAGSLDFNDQMKQRAPWVFLFVLLLAFVLLLLAFRSLVIPLTTIVLNLLSVGASYGFLVLVFQHTWAEGILDFRSTGAITAWLPLFLFVVLFGLSMDYHVFILSRIKERVDRGERTDQAVLESTAASAGTVSAAAIVMVAVFATFATLRTIDLKQLGVGLAFAVLIDATVIRALLVPATMKLLGERNWYLPRGLGWLPNLAIEAPAAETVTAASPAPPPGRRAEVLPSALTRADSGGDAVAVRAEAVRVHRHPGDDPARRRGERPADRRQQEADPLPRGDGSGAAGGRPPRPAGPDRDQRAGNQRRCQAARPGARRTREETELDGSASDRERRPRQVRHREAHRPRAPGDRQRAHPNAEGGGVVRARAPRDADGREAVAERRDLVPVEGNADVWLARARRGNEQYGCSGGGRKDGRDRKVGAHRAASLPDCQSWRQTPRQGWWLSLPDRPGVRPASRARGHDRGPHRTAGAGSLSCGRPSRRRSRRRRGRPRG